MDEPDPIRAALERLVDELNGYDPKFDAFPEESLAAAGAALEAAPADEPAVPEGREPAAVTHEVSDEDLKATYWKAYRESAMRGAEDVWLAGLRAVADLRRPATPPAVTDEPADAEGGLLPREAFADRAMCEGRENWLAGPRGVITLPGAAAAPVAPPAPAAGEVAELARWLRENADLAANADHHEPAELLTRAAALLEQFAPPTPQPVATPGEEYHDDLGPVLWWRFPVEEPPYLGTPNDSDWPGYHTHFTPLPQTPCCPSTTPAGQEGADG